MPPRRITKAKIARKELSTVEGIYGPKLQLPTTRMKGGDSGGGTYGCGSISSSSGGVGHIIPQSTLTGGERGGSGGTKNNISSRSGGVGCIIPQATLTVGDRGGRGSTSGGRWRSGP